MERLSPEIICENADVLFIQTQTQISGETKYIYYVRVWLMCWNMNSWGLFCDKS